MTAFHWLTPPAPAAIALVQVPAAVELLDRTLPTIGQARFARLRARDGTVVDEIVAERPTTDAMILMTHGGPGMRQAVERCLIEHGLHAQAPTADPLWQALAQAPSPAAVAWLLQNSLKKPVFSAQFLLRPPLVLITGPSNAGKSTLLNHWCGHQRALVSDIPGTTRDLIAGETVIHGWRVRLLDSAGLRRTNDPLEHAGQQLVATARGWADAVVSLRPPGDDAPDQPDDVVVLGKADLRPPDAHGLRWSAQEPTSGLVSLGAAVLERLRLPILKLD